MTNNAPIGVFDSGFGGLTVARAIIDQLPAESIRYVGDTSRGPYGPLPIAQVREYSLEIMDGLVDDVFRVDFFISEQLSFTEKLMYKKLFEYIRMF